MEKYLEGEEITVEELKAAIRKGTIAAEHHARAVRLRLQEQGRAAAAGRGGGLPALAAGRAGRSRGVNPKTGEEVKRATPSDDEPFSALAFKIMTDPYVGKLAFFRVYSGTLKAGSYVYNPTKGKRERIGRILQMHANHREEIEEVYAGDIAAAVGLRDTATGDTLCDEDAPDRAGEPWTSPSPSSPRPSSPRPRPTRTSWARRCSKLAEEDPTFRVHTDEETGQTIISGMGELHLEIIVDRLLREFKVEANVGRPQVAYRETHAQAGRGARASSSARPAAGASTATSCWRWSRWSRARASSS